MITRGTTVYHYLHNNFPFNELQCSQTKKEHFKTSQKRIFNRAKLLIIRKQKIKDNICFQTKDTRESPIFSILHTYSQEMLRILPPVAHQAVNKQDVWFSVHAPLGSLEMVTGSPPGSHQGCCKEGLRIDFLFCCLSPNMARSSIYSLLYTSQNSAGHLLFPGTCCCY